MSMSKFYYVCKVWSSLAKFDRTFLDLPFFMSRLDKWKSSSWVYVTEEVWLRLSFIFRSSELFDMSLSTGGFKSWVLGLCFAR